MLTRLDFLKMKQTKEKITMVTGYDFPAARKLEKAGVDMILVGDSLGNAVLGYDSTIQVTLEDMIHHAKAVKRGAKDTFTVVDMPFMSYHVSIADSMNNAKQLIQKTGAEAIKVEGATEELLTLTQKLTGAGIPVVGHLGLTPQSVNVLGGYKVQGKDKESSRKLLEDAKQLEKNGAMAIVLECIPKELATIITSSLNIPVIGIGAGVACDGQVLVYHDLLQYGTEKLAKFVKTYADLDQMIEESLKEYIKDVKTAQFPTNEQSYHMKDKTALPKQGD